AGHKGAHAELPSVAKIRTDEAVAGLDTPAAYAAFSNKVTAVCEGLRGFLAQAREEGKTVAGYGAAAKGNTLLNVAGIGTGDLAYVVDRNPEKQGTLLPGSHIPVRAPDALYQTRPDYVLILPWNLSAEIAAEHAAIADWGGRFVVAVPELTLL
ncbi:MAG: methyltransferase C-terminal domain-containing protein, partial [Pseudomonadota bacterium]